ncbi:MAG: hypothetical protein A2314_04170 [Elusimicrobia bacterium RIFOXYB2_FULL_50_12]|nr:MAG: hypothetical protein A2314_04170 [Elusimicrobia bacterium RIFOXYB2_FULL_50_12]
MRDFFFRKKLNRRQRYAFAFFVEKASALFASVLAPIAKSGLNRNIRKVVMAALIVCAASGMVVPAQLSRVSLVSNYPNPFDSRSGCTTIVYVLETEAEVKVRIFDLFGNQVREYPSRWQQSGAASLEWDGTDDTGVKVARGGYIALIEICREAGRLLAMRKIGVIH